MQKLISVIIPVYNHAHTLKKSLDSLVCQTYKNLEVIIVNDGSTDNFGEEINKILSNCHSRVGGNPDTQPLDPRFSAYGGSALGMTQDDKVIFDFGDVPIKIINQTNQGAPVARNRGFKEAHGEYVIFWDADTIAKPEMLAKMAQVLENSATCHCEEC